MTDTFTTLEQVQQTEGAKATLERLAEVLTEEQNYHKLFDVLLMQKKFEFGLPLVQPTSFDDVGEEHRIAFEQHYVESARQVGNLLIEQGKLGDAWVYFQTIREPAPVREALEQVAVGADFDDRCEELINVALYEGAHPVKGLELMLASHGTCNTITALDQQIMQLPEDDRRQAAALLVRQIYGDLCHTLNHEIAQRIPMVSPSENLHELISGDRDWLFSEGNYHIDVSHLNAVVRFSRSLNADDPELSSAVELAEYGSRLDAQFQYAAEPPFDDFYPAHAHFFRALLDDERDEAIAYFQGQIETTAEEEDKQMIAYVLVDLLGRIDLQEQAINLASQHLAHVDESSGFSFAEFCHSADRLDLLRNAARDRGDLVTWTAAMLGDATTTAASND